MIQTSLKIEEYCNNCPNFDANVEQWNHTVADSVNSVEVIISCKYENHCKYLMGHLKGVDKNDIAD